MPNEESRSLLREVLRGQTIDELVKQGFTHVEAEMIVDKDDINKKPEKESKPLLKRISIDISLADE